MAHPSDAERSTPGSPLREIAELTETGAAALRAARGATSDGRRCWPPTQHRRRRLGARKLAQRRFVERID